MKFSKSISWKISILELMTFPFTFSTLNFHTILHSLKVLSSLHFMNFMKLHFLTHKSLDNEKVWKFAFHWEMAWRNNYNYNSSWQWRFIECRALEILWLDWEVVCHHSRKTWGAHYRDFVRVLLFQVQDLN